ncbi:MAG: acetyltransferase [Sinobacteraceae bacterium]|nr:acetyltransferase [Nevskiaceae bacterium]
MPANSTETLSNPPRPIVIVGAGGHAISVANVALAAGFEIRCFFDVNRRNSSLLGFPIIDEWSELSNTSHSEIAIAIGDNSVRERVYLDFETRYDGLRFPPLIHPSAVVSSFTRIEEGAVIMPHATVGPNSRVEKFCIVNTQASIDHDCTMHAFSSIAPGAITGGGVTIGYRSAVSIGATIKHGIRIGNDSVLGANSYLNKDLASERMAYGSPAREIRPHRRGDTYLK